MKSSRRKKLSLSGITFKKKKISEQLQVSTATSNSEKTPTKSSGFSTKQILSRSVHKTKKALPSSPQKKAEVRERTLSM